MSEIKTKRRDTSKKRNSILDAAIECFTEHGFDNTSMDTIAKHANASKRTVYNHFESKEVLFQEVIKRFIATFGPDTVAIYRTDIPIDTELENILDQHIEMFVHNTDWLSFARIALGVFISKPEIAINVREICMEVEVSFQGWLEAARADGKIEIDDVQSTSDLFHATIDGLFLWPTMLSFKPTPEEAERYKQHILKSFKKLYITE